MRHLICSLCVLGATAVDVGGATPEVGIILPRGGQRGTDVVINLRGARLADAQELMSYSPGFTVSKLEVVGPTHVKATMKIAPDCALGEHAFRLRCASGISTLRTFWVGALPTVDEKEPNSEFTTPQTVPFGCTVHGVVTSEDVDYFVVEAKKGQRLSAEIEGMRLATAYFDPAIAILDDKRFELATSDDTPLMAQDGSVSVIAPADGRYIIRVRESAFGGNANDHYRLHIGPMPRPTAVYPAGGKPGDELEVTFLGDPLGEVKRKVKLPPDVPPGRFGLHLDDPTGISPSALPFRVIDLRNVLEVEPNHGLTQATPGTPPCAFNGIIAKPGEHDFFKFTAKKGTTLDIRCWARRLGSPLDPVMWIANAAGQSLAGSDDAESTPDSYFRFTAPADGDYFIGIRDHLLKGGPTFTYRIELTAPVPNAMSFLYKYGLFPTQERQTIDVPRGNRYAALVGTYRYDTGAELEIAASGLPAKVTVQADKLPNGYTFVPVVFEAAADAPIGGTFGELTAKPTDPKTSVAGRFNQNVEMVYGYNNAVFLYTPVHKIAIAVTEPVPFSIRVVEPKVPLVRDGAMGLKVVAERRDGFKAPIVVTPLFNPPGVGASAITIAEGQTEGVMPLTANSAAAVGQWKYVVMAYATVKDGPVWVSSQAAHLAISVKPVTVVIERAAAEQGKPAAFHGRVAVNAAFPGPAKVRLLGLPAKVAAPEIDLAADAKELSVPLTIDAASPAGNHKNLICQVAITQNGEPIVFTAGLAELRIDAPLPPKSKPAATAAAPPKPAAAAPPARPLTRLEKLRQEQHEREKGGQ